MGVWDNFADFDGGIEVGPDICSDHAHVRLQQRSIAVEFLEMLFSYGVARSVPCRRRDRRWRSSTESYRFTPVTWRTFAAHHPNVARRFERYRNVYAIVADGRLITAAYCPAPRHRRLRERRRRHTDPRGRW